MALSEIVAQFKKARGARHQPGRPGPRFNNRTPAMSRQARGSTSSSGSRLFKGRNSQKGESQDLQIMQSPIFRAYMDQMAPMTPMSDYLRNQGG